MDYTTDRILDPSCQVQMQPQNSANAVQSGCYNVKSTEMQQPEPQDTSAFIIREESSQAPMQSNQLGQDSDISQLEQLPDISIWRNGVSVPTAMPLFGGNNYSRSLFTIPDDFIHFLFDGNQPNILRNDDISSVASYSRWVSLTTQGIQLIQRWIVDGRLTQTAMQIHKANFLKARILIFSVRAIFLSFL